MTAEQEGRAQEAVRLLRDQTLNQALDALRSATLEQLVLVPAEQTTEVIKLQALAGALDGLRDQLRVFVTQGTPQKAQGGLV